MVPETIETTRLTLRRWTPDFLRGYQTLCSDPEVMAYIAEGLAYSPKRADQSQQKIFDHWETKGYGMYALFLKEESELVGIAGLATADYLSSLKVMPEIGWRLKKNLWGKGYATEAARAVLHALPDSIDELCAIIQTENDRSQSLARKLGFKLLTTDTDRDFGKEVQVWYLDDLSAYRGSNIQV